MFKPLTESIAKEWPEVQARIMAKGDQLAAKRDAAVKAATGDQKTMAPVKKVQAFA